MTQVPVAPGSAPAASNPFGITLYTVITPSGSDLDLQTQEEALRYEQVRDRYLHDNAFPNVSDLQDLDRLLVFEIVLYRWQLWLSRGFDYNHARIDESAIKGFVKEYSIEIRLLKLALGIDKATRDKEKGESVSDYVANLLERAKMFGYHRNKQYEKSVTAFWQLRSMIMTYDRCDEEERTHLDLSPETILEWFRDNVIKDWDESEAAFRASQSMWIREM